MNKLLTLALLFIATSLFAQDISGPWYGQLVFPGGKLRINLNITKTEAGYTATMDSPDQGANGIPVPTIAFEKNLLAFGIPQGGISFKGTLENDVIKGNFSQNGNDLPLELSRKEIVVEKAKRPQEPVKPYPYYEEEVTFKNDKAGITLAGTLTLPKKEGNYPVVILISGSGPQNRDEELLGHKPFLILSDYLTRKGIGVLRYDDRGTASSTGNFGKGTTQDFATDAEAALAYLKTRKEVNKKKIGLIGHSEGGIIAPIVANANPDVAYIVLLAGTAIPGDELLLLQQFLIGKANGMPEDELNKLGAINKKVYDAVKQETDPALIKKKATDIYTAELKPILISKGIPQDQLGPYIENQAAEIASPWFSNFMRYNPYPALEQVKCPILALNGEKDLQVPPTANLDAIKRAAAKSGNKKVVTKQLPNLNHLFQNSTTGSPQEYSDIEETFAPSALAEISNWILQQVK
ncbi:alpha/beta hydrolase [Flavobacterium zepuense]|uniref:Alpha/beta hydrolase n=1 Tax=Flavobacterium zepuense TaxID=2593302 RepID=A0A552V2K4_9FLAO|nr:alpha/beta hydrolase [Flavobacterium zepuense]TRW24678.1 alpha/beta hydrolase [Flavobacterium zepuense]